MLTFSRSHIANVLRGLPVLSRGSFATAAATRILPTDLEYSIKTKVAGSGQLSEAVCYAWSFLEGNVSDVGGLGRYYHIASDRADICAECPPWVQDAMAALVYCLRFLLQHQTEDAVNVAQNCFDAAWQYTVFSAVKDRSSGSRYHVDKWNSSPIVQAELSRQERDLTILKNSDPNQMTAAIRRLHEISKHERVVPPLVGT